MNTFENVEGLGKMNSEFLSQLKEEVLKSEKEARGPPTKDAQITEKASMEIEADYAEYDQPINQKDIATLRSIGKKSINNFTAEDIKKPKNGRINSIRNLG